MDGNDDDMLQQHNEMRRALTTDDVLKQNEMQLHLTDDVLKKHNEMRRSLPLTDDVLKKHNEMCAQSHAKMMANWDAGLKASRVKSLSPPPPHRRRRGGYTLPSLKEMKKIVTQNHWRFVVEQVLARDFVAVLAKLIVEKLVYSVDWQRDWVLL